MRVFSAMIVLVAVTLATACDIKREYKGSQEISWTPPWLFRPVAVKLECLWYSITTALAQP